MKTIDEMTLDEQVNWAVGKLTLAIGAGTFRDTVASVILAFTQAAWERGRKAGLADCGRRGGMEPNPSEKGGAA